MTQRTKVHLNMSLKVYHTAVARFICGLAFVSLAMSPSICVAHDPSVHAKITEAAELYTRQNATGYSNFINLIGGASVGLASDILSAPQNPPAWMQQGSRL